MYEDVRERAPIKCLQVPLNQGEFDALTTLCFNIGMGAFRKSTLVRSLNEEGHHSAINHWLVFDKHHDEKGEIVISLGMRKRRFVEIFSYLHHAIDLRTPEPLSRQGPFKHIPHVDKKWDSLSDHLKTESVNIYKGYVHLRGHKYSEEVLQRAEHISRMHEEYHPHQHSQPKSHVGSLVRDLDEEEKKKIESVLGKRIESAVDGFVDSLFGS